MGKYGDLFQDLLQGLTQRINHECAGAFFVSNAYKHIDIARVIYGHHKGLVMNCHDTFINSYRTHGSCDPLGRRFAIGGEKECLDTIKLFLKDIPIPDTLPQLEPYDFCSNSVIAQMLYLRMLMSCLVDADYISAAEHEKPEHYATIQGTTLQPDLLYKRKTTGITGGCIVVI